MEVKTLKHSYKNLPTQNSPNLYAFLESLYNYNMKKREFVIIV